MQELILIAPDMTCGHCEATIRKALGQEPAVKEVGIDLPTHRVTIRYDAAGTDADRLRSIIGEAGYETSVA